MTVAPKPVLKWAGGKRRLVPEILRELPLRMDTFYEPFVGGGAVFFALAAEGRFRRAVLSDRNPDLICVYEAIRDDVERVIAALRSLRYSEEEYYRIRSARPRSAVRRAARIIYLNRTGYNGLYRVNRSGEFNVPFGRYVRPKICDAENLRAVAETLRGVEVRVADFEEVVASAGSDDAVYFDPPYVPVSATSSFTAYHSETFGAPEHQRLARVFTELAERGVPVVLSNSNTPETRLLYKGFRSREVLVRRPINSDARRRGPVSELLVCGERRKRPVVRPSQRGVLPGASPGTDGWASGGTS